MTDDRATSPRGDAAAFRGADLQSAFFSWGRFAIGLLPPREAEEANCKFAPREEADCKSAPRGTETAERPLAELRGHQLQPRLLRRQRRESAFFSWGRFAIGLLPPREAEEANCKFAPREEADCKSA